MINVSVTSKKRWYEERKMKKILTIFVHISLIFHKNQKILSYTEYDTFS